MPVTTLDARAALVAIDLQKGLLADPTLHPIVDVIRRDPRRRPRDLRAIDHVLAAGLGAFALAMMIARHVGRFNGGDTPP